MAKVKNTTVNESVNSALGSVTGNKRWFSRLIGVGAGSSAYYGEEALKATGPTAFPVGTKINTDHQSWRDEDDYPAGSVRTMIGVIATTPVFLHTGESWEGYTADMDGLYAMTEFLDEWASFVEQVRDYVGLSIHAQYFAQEENYTDSGQMIIDGFVPSPINTVDLVTVPGAKGAILEAMESFQSIRDIMDSDNNDSRKDEGMTLEEITEAVSSALKPVTDRLDALEEAIKPVPDAEVEMVDISVADVAEAVAEAALPKSARQRVYAAVENGVVVKEAIDAEKAYIEEVKSEFESKGNFKMANESADDFGANGFGWN